MKSFILFFPELINFTFSLSLSLSLSRDLLNAQKIGIKTFFFFLPHCGSFSNRTLIFTVFDWWNSLSDFVVVCSVITLT
ncbi:hypothetical protein L2E82_32391 [Cichorium intybus]|uniref:Uncharacterized protein n=1 Tax=Cichorium intybus TaxID=13427 RepID=A0ACB9BHU8_CICIN|nr:hypothetical protein L2E82_32391 [Cichorium intybus]